MADAPAAPDRASIVELLLSIGRGSVDRDDDGIRFAPDGTISTAYAHSAAVMRDHADAFVSYAADPDQGVRRTAIESLGLFLDDADRAVDLLRGRLPAEGEIVERPVVVRTMADLALRLPSPRAAATAWLDALAGDIMANPDSRLAALVHRARCGPETISVSTVPTAIDLLGRLTPAHRTSTDEEDCRAGSGECVCAPATDAASLGTPPQIIAAFENFELSSPRNDQDPAHFFLNGWAKVLNPSEVASWLAFRVLSKWAPDNHLTSGVYVHGEADEYFRTPPRRLGGRLSAAAQLRADPLRPRRDQSGGPPGPECR
ncbi:hypothetical protein [Streptomyces sp. NPDC060035]|uniref:hypothetical protein n=1 Tax=Streptomyces sp. NPDC060035 TaxID=3347044 RepID=UPI00367CF2DE